MVVLQKARYDKIQHVREAAVRALAELGAIRTPPAATREDRALRRISGGAGLSSTARGSAGRPAASENSPPWSRSPRVAGTTGAAESPRLPLASSFNRPRVRRSADGKRPQAIDFGVKVFAPAGPPPPAAAEQHAAAAGSAVRSPASGVAGPAHHDSPCLAEASCQTSPSAGADGHAAASSPGNMADDGHPQQLEEAADLSSSAAVPAETGQPDSGASSLLVGRSLVRSPQASYGADEGRAGASADVCVHTSADGIALCMRPLAAEVDVALQTGYVG